jgi:hypothetical protein
MEGVWSAPSAAGWTWVVDPSIARKMVVRMGVLGYPW